MKVSISIGSAYYDGDDWEGMVELVQAADRLGVDAAWSAEAWGMEAVSSLGYLAAKTERIGLGSGIMQITARVPTMAAMTALSLARLSGDRFRLGLGVSGPQVVEGLHGVAFGKPLSRMREYVEVVRMALAGQKVDFQGEHVSLPRKGGEGKKSLELTGEIADGWLGTSFIPERADVLLDPIRRGALKAGRSLDDIDLQINGVVSVTEDVEGILNRARSGMAFTLGAMGSAKSNFYNAAYSRAGYEDVCKEVQRLWIDGDRKKAMAAVPDELLLAAYMIGTEDMVRARIRAFRDAGVNCLRIAPEGKGAKAQIENLERTMDLIKSETS